MPFAWHSIDEDLEMILLVLNIYIRDVNAARRLELAYDRSVTNNKNLTVVFDFRCYVIVDPFHITVNYEA